MTGRAIGLAALTACAAWLRFTAIGFGLPDAYDPAEDRVVRSIADRLPDADPTSLRLTARLGTAAIGTAAVPLVYAAASPFGATAGFAGAAIVAAATPAVRAAKLASGDAFGALALAAALAWGVRRERASGSRSLLARVVVITLLVAFLGRLGPSANPCLDGSAIRPSAAPATLLWRAFLDPLGVALGVLLVVGFAGAFALRQHGMAPALAAAALGVIALAIGASASRVLPVVLPAFAVLAGVQVEVGAAALRRRSSPLVAACLTAGALAALLVPSLIRDWKLSRLLLRPDTRSVARQWIDARVPPGEAVATLGGGACSRPRFAGTRAEIHLAAPPGAGEAPARWVVVDSTPFSALSPELSAAEIAALDARGTLALDLDPREAGTPVPLYDPVDPLFVPLQHASSVKRPGPRIRIWQLRSD